MTTHPQQIGKYAIRRALGQGAMGMVYEGFDPVIERKVAIKTILAEHLADGGASAIARFKREAQAGGRLQHPGIVAVHEYGEDLNFAYIVMEYVEGVELRKLMRERGRFDLSDSLEVMRQLLIALEYSHEHGVVHRDIKPANVMVLQGLKIKVMDFGIARIQSSSMTQVGTVLGTPTHMAPEQLMGDTADGRTDLWAAGVIFYELLTGRSPFAADSPAAVMHRVMQGDPMPASRLAPHVPPVLDQVLSKALTKSADQRYQSAAEFALALAQASVAMSSDPTIAFTVAGADPGGVTRSIWEQQTVVDPARAIDTAVMLALSAPTWAAVESALTELIGPMARHVMRSTAGHVRSVAEFYATLVDKIPDPQHRETFRARLARLSSQGDLSSGSSGAGVPTTPGNKSQPRNQQMAFDAATLSRAEKQLAHHVGPLAKVLIKRAAHDSGNLAELHRKLADLIESEPQRQEFLRSLR
ncbi:MAG: serine/threonine-protein kinase [Burkholderiaceae bacterium]